MRTHRKVRALQPASHVNLAECHLKLQVFSAATENSNKAQEVDSNNEKGLVHQGEAHLAANARADLQKGLQLYPATSRPRFSWPRARSRSTGSWRGDEALCQRVWEAGRGGKQKAQAAVAAGKQPADMEMREQKNDWGP